MFVFIFGATCTNCTSEKLVAPVFGRVSLAPLLSFDSSPPLFFSSLATISSSKVVAFESAPAPSPSPSPPPTPPAVLSAVAGDEP